MNERRAGIFIIYAECCPAAGRCRHGGWGGCGRGDTVQRGSMPRKTGHRKTHGVRRGKDCPCFKQTSTNQCTHPATEMASAMAGAPFLHESGHRSHGRWDCTLTRFLSRTQFPRESVKKNKISALVQATGFRPARASLASPPDSIVRQSSGSVGAQRDRGGCGVPRSVLATAPRGMQEMILLLCVRRSRTPTTMVGRRNHSSKRAISAAVRRRPRAGRCSAGRLRCRGLRAMFT